MTLFEGSQNLGGTTNIPFQRFYCLFSSDDYNYQAYHIYKLDEMLSEKLVEDRENFRSRHPDLDPDFGALRFALDSREAIRYSLNVVNRANHHYSMSLATFTQKFKDKYLRRLPYIDGLELKIYLRWLKNMSTKLGLLRTYQALVIMSEVENDAPSQEDNEDVYSWLERLVCGV